MSINKTSTLHRIFIGGGLKFKNYPRAIILLGIKVNEKTQSGLS